MTTTIEDPEVQAEATELPQEGEQAEVAEVPNENPDPSDADIPALRHSLTKANAEAAKYRVELRTAQEALAAARTVEEFEKATGDLNATIARLEREVVVEKHRLPEALAKRLQGTTREELEADAIELAKLIVRHPEVDPDEVDGGLNPRGASRELTQAELVAKYGPKRISL